MTLRPGMSFSSLATLLKIFCLKAEYFLVPKHKQIERGCRFFGATPGLPGETASMAEKMITIAKKDTLANKRQVMAFVTKEDVATKLFKEIAPRYEGRNGGYTRITKIGPRRGDAAEMAIIELV